MDMTFNNFCKNFNIVTNAINMRCLERWNGRNLKTNENLSEHTHLAVACAIELYDDFKSKVDINFEKLIKMVMLHDSLELFTGDILSVTKDCIPNLRKAIDNYEDEFIKSCLKDDYSGGVEKDLVELADVKACFEFISEEIKYTNNNFIYKVYDRSLNVYNNKFVNFCKKYNIKLKETNNDVVKNRFTKGYENDAGTDIILDNDVTFLPHKTTVTNMKVKITPKKGEMAVLCARTSAAAKGLSVATCPIDADYQGEVTAIIHNISNDVIKYKKGESFCQYVGIKLVDITNINDEVVVKKIGKRTDGKLGSTGR